MSNTRHVALSLAALVGTAVACTPQPDAIRPATGTQAATVPQAVSGLRYEATIDPVAHTISVHPVGMRTQAAGVWVRSANAVWNAPTFSFDLLVTNNSGTTMSTVRGVVLSTTPGSPTVIPTGTHGTLAGGQPYYDYGSIANGATGSTNWRFSIPSVTPFRFGFTVQHGSGTDAAPGKNQAPSVVSVTPASGSVSAGNSTTITATTSDPNSDSLTYAWSAPSGGSISGTGATVTYTAPGAPGTYPVNVIVDDGKGATANGSTTISVTAGGGNGTAQGNASFGPTPAAAVKQVTLSPAAVTIDPGEPLTITATGRDNPGNAVATKWTWSQVGSTNSIWRGTFDHGTSGNTATWRSFDGRTDSGTVTVTARSADNQKASMTITVREKPPVVQAASPAATVTVNRNVATPFSVTFHDPNGNNTGAPSISVPPSVGYSGGSSFNQITGNYTMNLNMTFTAVGTFPVTITQSDGSGSGTKTWNVTVI